MQSNIHHILSQNCLIEQQLRNSFRMHGLLLAIQYNLGDSFLKSSKDFIN